jgi:hypothetical protein
MTTALVAPAILAAPGTLLTTSSELEADYPIRQNRVS